VAASTLSLGLLLAACSSDPPPAPAPDRSGQAPSSTGTGSGDGGIHLAPGGPVELTLPSGEPLRLTLPPGAAATLDLGGERPELVVTITDEALGFGLGATVPADPAAAARLLSDVVGALDHAGPGALGMVSVTGYASSEGTAESNQVLSEGRAAWVCHALGDAGVPATAITCAGKGEANDLPPLGPGPEDRRVEIRVSATPG
jgi:outer membrane protein OmpA-like peptidoglycan-associated protein